MRGLLLDENLAEDLARAVHSIDASVPIHWVGDGIAPPKGTADPDILVWCENHRYVLVTNNRRSMPDHLAAHLEAGRQVPGILQVPEEYTLGVLADHLALRFGASLVGELANHITHIHLDEG